MKWIWTECNEGASFGEFRLPFTYKEGRTILKISSEYRHVAYINGVFAANGQYPDIPSYKIYDEIDVTHLVKIGENELRVQAFHMGIDANVARSDIPCVAFEIYCDGKWVCGSDENTDCRDLTQYSVGANTTAQLGFGFCYDFTAKEASWKKATVKETGYKEVLRPVKKTLVENEALGIISAQGAFMKTDGKTEAEIIQNCWMKTILFDELAKDPFGKVDYLSRQKFYDLHQPIKFICEEGDGIFVIVDLGRNTVGFPIFKVKVNRSCKAYLCWGEHLQDLRVRSYVGGRNFAYGITLKKGENEFAEYFRRIGGRYMGFYVENREITIEKIGMIADEYPLKKPEKDFGDRLLNKIYETGRRTMELCLHDHYEDCPWREQVLYTGDARIQMMFGYGAFEETEMPRSCLKLMALCIEEDGLLPFCTPSRMNLNTAGNSFPWIAALYDYVEETNDIEFLKEMLPYAERTMKTYEAHTTDKGIMMFGEPKYWNFHEWSEGLTGPLNGKIWRTEPIESEPDGALTAYGLFSTLRLVELYKKVGDIEKSEKYSKYCKLLKKGIEAFYDEEKGLYRSYLDREQYHAYTNSIILASGIVKDEKRIKAICEALKYPEKHGMVEMNLAYYSIKYDVLIKYANGLDFVINHICDIFGGMLFAGSTSYWETLKGEMDFGNAGSLCHGWAAVACYVLDKYYKPLKRTD